MFETCHSTRKKIQQYNETKRVNYRGAFRSLLKGSSSGGNEKEHIKETHAHLDLW